MDDDAAEAVERPDWVDVYAGQNQQYEGVEKDFDYDDGGEQYDWSSISINLPEGKDPKTWLGHTIKQAKEQETVGLELPDVSPLSLYDNQRALVILVLYALSSLSRMSLIIILCNLLSLEPQEQESRMSSSAFRG